MPKLNPKLKPMPKPDTMLDVPSTVIPVTDTVMVTTITARGLLRPMLNLMDTMDMDMVMDTVTDTVMVDTDTDTITAKDPLNLTMDTDLVLPPIPVMPLHMLHLPPGVWENRL